MRRAWKSAALHSVLVASGIFGGAYSQAAMILEDNVLVSAANAPRVESFGMSAAGKWTITVTDIVWPQLLQSLSFAISDLRGVLISQSGPGTLTYDVVTPTTLFATVYALPNAARGSGLYHINVSYAPAVPLPAAGWLLFSGIAGLVAWRRKHATVTNSVVQ